MQLDSSVQKTANSNPIYIMASFDQKTVWHDVLGSVKVSVSPAIFSTWFSQTHLVNLKKTNKRYLAEIGCASTFVKTTVESRYFGLLQDSLGKILDAPCDLMFIVRESPEKEKLAKTEAPLFEKKDKNGESFAESMAKTGVRPGFSFENFAVSSSNQMAWAAAEAVSKSPGTAYNPLFIWGGVGVGKTHLMNAVGHYILKKDIDAKNGCVHWRRIHKRYS